MAPQKKLVTDLPVAEPDVGQPANLMTAFRQTVARRPDEMAIRTLDDSVSWTWSQLAGLVDDTARGLYSLGLRAGDCVALMLGNRPEFFVCDLAALRLAITPFSIYQTAPTDQIRYMVRDSAARTIITETRHLGTVLDARRELPQVDRVIVVDGAPESCLGLAQVLTAGRETEVDLDAAAGVIDGETLLTLIYTSGTTGQPKGVELVHRNALASVWATRERIPFPYESRIISWLPAAHIAERIAHYYLPMVFGIQITCCPDPKEIGGALAAVQPTWFFGVPRIWEKIRAGIEVMLAGGDEQSAKLRDALDVSLRRVRHELAGQEVPEELAAAAAQADRVVFADLRRKLGFGELVVANVGSAPTPREVLEFFHAIGVRLSEIWGMSETCGAGCSNPYDKVKIGTVGPPAPGVELRLASDGEVLIRSDVVMRGYRNMPEQTAETLAGGWLHTGDLGKIDDDGYVRIIDRKKDLIINSAGKNMSPAFIESQLKSASPLIGQVCCVGDGRPYNTALIVLDLDVAPAWATGQGLDGTGLAELATDKRVIVEIASAVERANARLSRPEQIKKFHLLSGEWSVAGGELTPSMKLRRVLVLSRYAAEIDAMYHG